MNRTEFSQFCHIMDPIRSSGCLSEATKDAIDDLVRREFDGITEQSGEFSRLLVAMIKQEPFEYLPDQILENMASKEPDLYHQVLGMILESPRSSDELSTALGISKWDLSKVTGKLHSDRLVWLFYSPERGVDLWTARL